MNVFFSASSFDFKKVFIIQTVYFQTVYQWWRDRVKDATWGLDELQAILSPQLFLVLPNFYEPYSQSRRSLSLVWVSLFIFPSSVEKWITETNNESSIAVMDITVTF